MGEHVRISEWFCERVWACVRWPFASHNSSSKILAANDGRALFKLSETSSEPLLPDDLFFFLLLFACKALELTAT